MCILPPASLLPLNWMHSETFSASTLLTLNKPSQAHLSRYKLTPLTWQCHCLLLLRTGAALWALSDWRTQHNKYPPFATSRRPYTQEVRPPAPRHSSLCKKFCDIMHCDYLIEGVDLRANQIVAEGRDSRRLVWRTNWTSTCPPFPLL
jgi:hypothetical protein